MQIIDKKIEIGALKQITANTFGNLVKVVVDVERELIAIDAELHSDLEALLLENGSKQKNLWGINLYPEMTGCEFIEFDSLINIRPSVANKSRGVESEEIRKKIASIIAKRIIR